MRLGGRGAEDTDASTTAHLVPVAVAVEQGLKGRSPKALDEAALLRILKGDEDVAISYLREAVEHPGKNAALLNDLAFAYMVKGQREGDPLDETAAYEKIEESLRIDPSFPEARFNKAVVLEKLGLSEQAHRAWQRYLEVDSDSSWGETARREWLALGRRGNSEKDWEYRRHRLTMAARSGDNGLIQVIVAQDPQRSRLYAEDWLFASWARNFRNGNMQEATQQLRLARLIGDVSAKSGDPLIRDAAIEIEAADSRQINDLMEGHLRYEQARKAYQGRSPGVAKPLFAQAEKMFARSENAFAFWASFHRAACLYFEKDYEEAMRLAVSLRREAKTRGYLSLEGRTAWLIGLIQLEVSEPARALETFQQALVQFQKTGELGHQGSVLSLMASAYEYMGDRRSAWKHRCMALATAGRAKDQRYPVVLGEAARAATRGNLHALALTLQDEAVEVALSRGGVLALSEAYWWRAEAYHQAGRPKEALEDLEAARKYSIKIDDHRIRQHTWAGIAALEGAIRRFEEPERGVTLLSSALDYYTRNQYRYPLVELYLHRGQAFLGLGDTERAQEDFLAGISEYETQRVVVDDLRLRITFFDQAQGIFEELIRLQVGGHGQGEQGFQYADRSKARALWDTVGGLTEKEPPSLSQRELQKLLPPNTLVVTYCVLPEEIIRWSVDTRRIEMTRVPLARKELRRLVESLRSTAVDPDLTAFLYTSARLYRILLGGLDDQLESAARVVFIPDKELSGVPFAALSEPGSGRFFVEARGVSVAPSISTYIWASHRAQKRRSNRATALVIGDPAFDRRRYPQLPHLVGAEAEAQEVASFFPQSELLMGPEATAERFLAEVDRYELIHFSGHVLPNLEAPYLSKLILAPDDGHLEGLSARELYALGLERPVLAVLSGCLTARGAEFDLEGSTDPARAFLAAGVPAVIGTLWAVDDRSSREITVRFYRYLQRGEDAVAALRFAQVEAIRGGVSLESWAGFQLTGAAAKLTQ